MCTKKWNVTCTTCNNEKLQIIRLSSMNYNHKTERYIATKIRDLELEVLKRMTLMVSNRAKQKICAMRWLHAQNT